MLTIRQEMPNDYEEIYTMVKQAFASADYSDGTEQDYLNAIRKKDTFIPELSLVAQINDQIVGQIVLYKMQLQYEENSDVQLVLSPLSVHPDYFGQGIGTKLIREGCARALDSGYKVVFLCGDYKYYSRFGFVPTYKQGIYHIKDVNKNADWCMVKELENGYLANVKGVIDIE